MHHRSVIVVILAPREVGIILSVLVPGVRFLALREVTATLIVHARMAGLLTLGEVAAMVLLRGVARLFLAFGEGGVLVVVAVIGVLVIMAGRVVVTVIVVGMIAHARVLPAIDCLRHCGPPVKRSAAVQRATARRLMSRIPTWIASRAAVTISPA